MRTEDGLLFAPGICFMELDAQWDNLPELYGARMRGFYLEPARSIAPHHAFAAGVLLVCCIDGLALARHLANPQKDRGFVAWVREELPSFRHRGSGTFYERFRCGIVHEGRVKLGSEFSTQQPRTVLKRDHTMIVNPILLADEIDHALQRFILQFRSNDRMCQGFQAEMAQLFAEERQRLAATG